MNPSTLALGVILILVIVTGLACRDAGFCANVAAPTPSSALLEHADQLEDDLKECRQRLEKAHAVMTATAGVPPRQPRHDARKAVDSGLRSLLQHRLWIRDHAETASQPQLDAAVQALRQARRQMEPQLAALGRVQRDLDQAVRERIERDRPDMSAPRVVLASTSRYRAELLRRLLPAFRTLAPGVDEAPREGESPATACRTPGRGQGPGRGRPVPGTRW